MAFQLYQQVGEFLQQLHWEYQLYLFLPKKSNFIVNKQYMYMYQNQNHIILNQNKTHDSKEQKPTFAEQRMALLQSRPITYKKQFSLELFLWML